MKKLRGIILCIATCMATVICAANFKPSAVYADTDTTVSAEATEPSDEGKKLSDSEYEVACKNYNELLEVYKKTRKLFDDKYPSLPENVREAIDRYVSSRSFCRISFLRNDLLNKDISVADDITRYLEKLKKIEKILSDDSYLRLYEENCKTFNKVLYKLQRNISELKLYAVRDNRTRQRFEKIYDEFKKIEESDCEGEDILKIIEHKSSDIEKKINKLPHIEKELEEIAKCLICSIEVDRKTFDEVLRLFENTNQLIISNIGSDKYSNCKTAENLSKVQKIKDYLNEIKDYNFEEIVECTKDYKLEQQIEILRKKKNLSKLYNVKKELEEIKKYFNNIPKAESSRDAVNAIISALKSSYKQVSLSNYFPVDRRDDRYDLLISQLQDFPNLSYDEALCYIFADLLNTSYDNDLNRNSMIKGKVYTGYDARLVVFIYVAPHSRKMSPEEQAEVNKKKKEIIKLLDIEGKSDLEKVTAIYNYLIKIHFDESGPTKGSTIYDALVRGRAVCAGISIAFYELCKEVGIHAEIIWGNIDEQVRYDSDGIVTDHAWNIVKIENEYYNIDALNKHFLLNNKDLGFIRYPAFNSKFFNEKFPMSKISFEKRYVPGMELKIPNKLKEEWEKIDKKLKTAVNELFESLLDKSFMDEPWFKAWEKAYEM